MNYPNFDEGCESALKKFLTREIWSKMKKRATHLGGKIQLCVQCGVYDPSDPIGVYATDEEAYTVFDEVFGPIIRFLHRDFDPKYTFKHDFELAGINSFENFVRDSNKMPLVKVTARRNFKDYPFLPMMSTEVKIQVER